MKTVLYLRRRRGGYMRLMCAVLLSAAVIFPAAASEGARSGLRLCGSVLVPSLLPFMVLSAWAAEEGMLCGTGRVSLALMRWAFNMPGAALGPLLSGWLCGYPAGARAAARAYEDGLLTKAQAERLLTFCVCASPQFAIAAVGVSLMGNAYAGVCIYLGAVGACIVTGVVGGLFSRREKGSAGVLAERHPSGGFAAAVADGTESMLKICALTVLFAAFIGVAEGTGALTALCRALSRIGGSTDMWSAVVKIAAELANGASAAVGVRGGFAICAAGSGFGGVCVLAQCAALARTKREPLRLAPMLLSRAAHAALTAVFALLLMRLDTRAVMTFSAMPAGAGAVLTLNNIPAAVIMLMTAAVVLMRAASRGERGNM